MTKNKRTKMRYSEAFINRTKAQLLEHNRKLSREIAALNREHDTQVESYRKVVEENKRLQNELAKAAEKVNSAKHELDGVRGALGREAEMRKEAEKDRDKYMQDAVKWKNEAGDCHNKLDGACTENELLRNYRNKVEEIQQKYNVLTLESLDNSLHQWNYVNGKLSYELHMPLETLIQLLDEYWVNDFCKLRDRLMYGPTDDYSNALANVRKLEKERDNLKHVADDLEKQRRDLEQKLAQEHNVAMVQEARATDMERQLRRKTNDCGYWIDRAFRDEAELKKSKEHDRIAQENFEKAARRNDELQNEVNRLRQRWTDTFNPEDEMLGRKVLEWQEINVVLARHNIENSMVLDSELDMLKEYRKVLDKHSSAMNGVIGADPLDKLLSDRETDIFGYPVADWKRVLDENFVDCPGKLAAFLKGLEKYRRVMRNHGITNGQDELDDRLENLEGLVKVCEERGIKTGFDLQKRLDEIGDLRRQSCPEEYMKVFSKYGIDSAEKLDGTLEKWFRVRQCSIALRNDMPYLGSIADFIKELA